VKEAILLI